MLAVMLSMTLMGQPLLSQRVFAAGGDFSADFTAARDSSYSSRLTAPVATSFSLRACLAFARVRLASFRSIRASDCLWIASYSSGSIVNFKPAFVYTTL